MSSEARFSASKSLGRNSIPVLATTYRTRATSSLPNSEVNNLLSPKTEKYVYTDGDVKECPPEGNSVPIIAFPGDDANNSAMKQYLLDVLTKTGWGIAIESSKEIRATINAFIGNGYVLRTCYAENRLRTICPAYLTAIEDGVPRRRKISASTRSNIGKCIMREMERYFEEDRVLNESRYDSDGDKTLVFGSSNANTCIRHPRDVIDKEDEEIQQQFRRRPQSRATLPDQWMSESLRVRTKSRLSGHSFEKVPPMRKSQRATNDLSVFVNKSSAYPMQMNITSKPQRQHSAKGKTLNSFSIKSRQEDTKVENVQTSRSRQKHTISPYQTIPGSSLPRPKSSFGNRPIPRATHDVRRSTLRDVKPHGFANDAGNLASTTTLTSNISAASGPPAGNEIMMPSTDANEDADDADDTPHAMPSVTENQGDTENVAKTAPCPTTTHPSISRDVEGTNKVESTDDNRMVSQTQSATIDKLEQWLYEAPTPTDEPQTRPMTTLSSSPQPEHEDLPEDPDAIAFTLPASDFIDSDIRGVDKQEVKEAVVQTEEVTAAQQQMAVTKGKKRWFLKRLWRKARGRKNVSRTNA